MKTIKRVQTQGKSYFFEVSQGSVNNLFMIEYQDSSTVIEPFDSLPRHSHKQVSTVAMIGDYKNWNRWLRVQINSPRVTEEQRSLLKTFLRQSTR